MAISFTHRGILWIVLDEENVDRIQHHDPFEFNGEKAPGVVALRVPIKIRVAYARKDELPHLALMQDNPDRLVEHLSRGFTVTASDHDRGYEVYDRLKKDKP